MFPPTGKEMQKGSIKNLAAQYIGARWLATLLHWCVIKAIEMLASTVPM
jgi:hypothetical protein